MPSLLPLWRHMQSTDLTEDFTYMIKDEASKKTGSVSDVVVLVVPHVTKKLDGERHLIPLLPVEFSNYFQDLLCVVLAQVGVEQLDDELLEWRPFGLRLLLKVGRVDAVVRILDHHDVPEKQKMF